MALSNEQIQAILDGAPDDFTHIDLDDGEYEVYGDGTRSLSDLGEILTLRQEVERLKAQQSEVASRAVEDVSKVIPAPNCSCEAWLHNYANQLREQGK